LFIGDSVSIDAGNEFIGQAKRNRLVLTGSWPTLFPYNVFICIVHELCYTQITGRGKPGKATPSLSPASLEGAAMTMQTLTIAPSRKATPPSSRSAAAHAARHLAAMKPERREKLQADWHDPQFDGGTMIDQLWEGLFNQPNVRAEYELHLDSQAAARIVA
jgi:hypothetical protein